MRRVSNVKEGPEMISMRWSESESWGAILAEREELEGLDTEMGL